MRLVLLCLLFILLGDGRAYAQTPSDIQAYVERYKSIALQQERQHGVPASITLAQGILESAAGKSRLTQRSNNHFGIKRGRGWSGQVAYAWDDDPQKSPFRCYASAEDSFRDHSQFLRGNSRYARLFSLSVYDYRRWAYGLKEAGYATSATYAQALIGYIDHYRLYSLNGGVKLNPKQRTVIKRDISREELVKDKELQIDEQVETEEEQHVAQVVSRYVAVINDIRCTILMPGQTLASIAIRNDIPLRKLIEWNERGDENEYKEGDIVFLAKKKKKYTGPRDDYVVQTDSADMYQIAQQFGIWKGDLEKMNGGITRLQKGQRLRLK